MKNKTTVEREFTEPTLLCDDCGSSNLTINRGPAKTDPDGTPDFYFTCNKCGMHGDWGHVKWSHEVEEYPWPPGVERRT